VMGGDQPELVTVMVGDQPEPVVRASVDQSR